MLKEVAEEEAKLDTDRAKLYDDIRKSIGSTPFRELSGLAIPNRCRIFVKEEFRNPTGSHYDREMWRFLKGLEEQREILPGETWMIETTTGNSGASFAWLCRILGYPAPHIVIPADMPPARLAQIRSYGAELVLSPAGEYITGVASTFGKTLADMVRARVRPLPWSPKHWQDETYSVAAMEELGEEILRDAQAKNIEFDNFVLALGNGASSRGMGSVFRSHNIRLLGMEPAESRVVARYRGEVDKNFEPTSHGILGTGPFLETEIYPNMREAAKFLDEIIHPTTQDCRKMQIQLADRCGLHVGMSSAGCVWSALEYIREHGIRSQVFGAVCYDAAWKYF